MNSQHESTIVTLHEEIIPQLTEAETDDVRKAPDFESPRFRKEPQGGTGASLLVGPGNNISSGLAADKKSQNEEPLGCCEKNGDSALPPPESGASPPNPPRFATPGSIRVAEIDGPSSLDFEDILTEEQAIHESDEENSTQHEGNVITADLVPSDEEMRYRILQEVSNGAASAVPIIDPNKSQRQRYLSGALISIVLCAIIGTIAAILTKKNKNTAVIITDVSPSVSMSTSLRPSDTPSFSKFPSLRPSYLPSISMSPTNFLVGINNIVALHSELGIPDTGTPQFKSLVWLSMNKQVSTYSDSVMQARYAIATLVFTSRINTSTVLTEDFHCKWPGITCDGVNETLDEVTAINASLIFTGSSDDGIKFSFPPEIALLSNSLTYLYYEGSRVEFGIPTEFGLLSKLTELSIQSDSQEFAAFPSVLGMLTDLETLRFVGSKSGSVLPTEVGMLSKLQVLDLSLNNFEGSSIPSEIGNLSKLAYLNLSYCTLIGDLPSNVLELSNLMVLKLQANSLEKLPSGIFNNKSKIEHLDMSTNSLSDIGFYEDFSNGTVVWKSELANLEKIGLLSALTYLDLSYNNFIDLEIPAEIGNLTNLQHLDFYNAKVSGTIPKEIALLTNLSYLDMSSNNLIGAVPSDLSGLTSLYTLMLDSNYLSGTINCSLYPVLQISADCLDKVNCTGGCCFIDFYIEGSVATVYC